jgi:hypothetical protein
MNIAELKSAAEAATEYWGEECEDEGCTCWELRRAFIALANPATILKLIAVAEAAQEIHEGRLKVDCYPALYAALKELKT